MDAEAVDDVVADMRADTVNAIVGEACPPGSYPEQWNVSQLKARVSEVFGLEPDIDAWLQEDAVDPEMLEERIREMAEAKVEAKASEIETGMWRSIEKSVLLQSLDHHWKEHLATLDALRQVVFLRAYAQKTPINEYKSEAFGLFERMLEVIREDVTGTIMNLEIREPEVPALPELPDFLTTHFDPFTGEDNSADIDGGTLGTVTATLPPRQSPMPEASDDLFTGEISRNAPCPCGSGRKYKHCHGKAA